MEKLAVAEDVADVVDLDAPIADNLRRIAERRGKRADDITVAVLHRPRHADLVRDVLATGARIKFLLDGDVAGAILAADPASSVDVCVGIGGTPEGVIAACALRCLDGQLLGRLYPRNDGERAAALDRGYDLDRVLSTRDLVSGDDIFFAATGVTSGELLQGVRYTPNACSPYPVDALEVGRGEDRRRPPPRASLQPDPRGDRGHWMTRLLTWQPMLKQRMS